VVTYTQEQEAIIETQAPCLVVKAGPGTGKTQTLVGYAQRRHRQRGLYVAYNKAIQIEATQRFQGTGVKASTAHALAFRRFGAKYQHKLAGTLPLFDIAAALDLDDGSGSGEDRTRTRTLALASWVRDTVLGFCHSADPELELRHVPREAVRLASLTGPDATEEEWRAFMVALARELWDRMCDEDGGVPMIHDGYLKLYQLSSPRLDYDYLMEDEAQDENPCLGAILGGQAAPKVLVGDEAQAIYRWRGARDALGEAVRRGGTERLLTGSFRFGERIAGVANGLLAMRGQAGRIVGLGGADAVGPVDSSRSRTILSRSNAGVFSRTVDALLADESWWHIGWDSYRFEQILEVYWLWNGEPGAVKDPLLRLFDSFEALKDYAKEVQDFEVLSRIKVVERYEKHIPVLIETIKNRVGAADSMASARVVLSTAHKAKGLEFGQVVLDGDFLELCEVADKVAGVAGKPEEERREFVERLIEEVNLIFVAATRAKWRLQLNNDLADAMGLARA
jgi:hypothetical protein